MKTELNRLVVGIKGAGEMASAVAWRLYMANIKTIFMLEMPHPLAVRRSVSFSEAVYKGAATVEGVEARKAGDADGIRAAWHKKAIAVLVDPHWTALKTMRPQVVIDAILAKTNMGTAKTEAPLVIGLGPGFTAPSDVHMVIETNRGHYLGSIITDGSAALNTGIPGNIGGHTDQRVLRAPLEGIFKTRHSITNMVKSGDVIGTVESEKVYAGIDGVLRGLLRSGSRVSKGLKIGDIDPRKDKSYCYTISDKARAIGGSLLEAILRVYNV
ncbi:MAG: selenium-dependent molybdenum cofactor biosynthesis protein YqeB [Desulfobacterales bacterium]|nr:selenium-dependent molybdenum cofactor biosynthesis protein YqeB [Desulfobacterales bacterium]